MKLSPPVTAFWASPSMRSAEGSSDPTRTASAPRTGTSDSPSYSIGIDPGYGESGVVLVARHTYTESVLEFGLVRDKFGPEFPTVFRSQAVAARLIEQGWRWVEKHGIRDLDIAIELPIYNSNPENFAKQYTLIQALEGEICRWLAVRLDRCWITEPNPSESKRLATGDGSATKEQVLRASPFYRDLEKLVEGLNQNGRMTLADAWAHSLACRGGAPRRFDAKMIKWPTPRRK